MFRQPRPIHARIEVLLLLGMLAGLLAPDLLRAQSAVPAVNSATLFLQRGQSMEAPLTGQHLANVTSIALPHARGLQVSIVRPPKTAKPSDGQLRLKLWTDPDAALGEREMRLVSPLGVSAPLHVIVGQYPAIAEKEPNNTWRGAQDVSLPATLIGRIDPPGDIDCFGFQGARGQTLVFDLHAMRDGSPLDPVMSVHDSAGRELPTRADHHSGDPTLLFDVPADGKYILLVRDLQYRGGGDFAYRIDAGAIPYVQSVLPMTAPPGKISELSAIGVNLSGAGRIPLDLTYATWGDIAVRAQASSGLSNPVKVEVTDLPAFADSKPAHASRDANAVPIPIDISGHLDKNGDESFFKFHVPAKQVITIEAFARRMGSPMDALITLRNAQGAPMQTMDDGDGPDPAITRELDAGDYQASIRDLFFNGGPSYAYRLQIRPGVSAARQQGLASLRFLPDAPRISRGGNAAIFVDLRRGGEFKGDVTITVEGLPPGVTCPPLVMNEKLPGASGMLMLSAAGDTPVGSFPIELRASAIVNNQLVTRVGKPMRDGKPVEQAYLAVLDPAPFSIDALADLSPTRLKDISAQADALAARLASRTPELAAAQSRWEQSVAGPLRWDPLDNPTITAAAGTTFKLLPDGSILAGNPSPDRDTYTIVAPSDVPGITAFRIEAIPDPSLPGHGPGRNSNGNFVLSHLVVTVAPIDEPDKKTTIKLRDPRADFEQDGYPVIDAIDPKPGRGWAMYPRGGSANEAYFFTDTPVGDHNGSIFTFTLDQQFGQQHTLGRFRISYTTDPRAKEKSGIPAAIADLLALAPDKRTPEQAARVADFYRSVDPQWSADSRRLKVMRDAIGLLVEREKLEFALTAETPELDAQRDRWEKSALGGAVWLPVEFDKLASQNGASLQKQPDGSIFVGGNNPPTDVYTLSGSASARRISALRIEALPDPRLPAGGPGRAPSGNFVLSKITLFASPLRAQEMAPPIEFKSASATFEQQGYPASATLDDNPRTGWAVAPNMGKPSVATFQAAIPVKSDDSGTALTLVLEQQFAQPNHTLGHFRVWATASRDPDAARMLPDDVLAILKEPAAKRNPGQKEKLSAYYRSIAPSLDPIRRELAQVDRQLQSRLKLRRGREFTVPFVLNRAGFTGDVKVSLEGFIAGRDPATAAPTPIGGALKFDPLNLGHNAAAGDLKIKIEPNSGFGTRYCVLRAEANVAGDTRVEYSAPFVLTVLEK